MKIRIAAATDVGKERTNNEDAFGFCPDLQQYDWMQASMPSYMSLGPWGAVVVVADGMGGVNAGEVASATAVKAVRDFLTQADVARHVQEGTQQELLEKCVWSADEAINQKTHENPRFIDMGTTLVICWILDVRAYVAWCGDSRCYVYHPARGLRRLTKDHSYVQELVDLGGISEEETFLHPDNNVITRSLGDIGFCAVPDVVDCMLSPCDTLMLCTDGLCGYCTDVDMERALDRCHGDTAACCDRLVQMSLDAGGYDNVCVAVASVTYDGAPASRLQLLRWRMARLYRRVCGKHE